MQQIGLSVNALSEFFPVFVFKKEKVYFYIKNTASIE